MYDDGVRHIDGMGESGGEPSELPSLLCCRCRSGAKSKSSRRRSPRRFRNDDDDLGMVPRMWCRWSRGQLVGENAPMVSSVSDETGDAGAGLGSIPRGSVTK